MSVPALQKLISMPTTPMSDTVHAARQFYAEELRAVADVKSRAVRDAFAIVPRETFVGPGPWRIMSVMSPCDYRTTEDDDPRHIYHDVLVALDEARGYNNGQPSFWAFLIDKLGVARDETIVHLGCGTGYYSAILAELVGPGGRVRAIEMHEGLGARAREALAPWPQATVEVADGSDVALDQADVIVSSAGATGPLPAWLDALRKGGRLLLPLTSAEGPGGMLLVTRRNAESYAARFLSPAAFVDFLGVRDPEASTRLAAAFRNDHGSSVKSLRRDPHEEDDSCWLHGEGWCLSRRELSAS